MKKKSKIAKKAASSRSASNKGKSRKSRSASTLYSYVQPVNRRFAISKAKKLKMERGYSELVDLLLTYARTSKIKILSRSV